MEILTYPCKWTGVSFEAFTYIRKTKVITIKETYLINNNKTMLKITHRQRERRGAGGLTTSEHVSGSCAIYFVNCEVGR